MPLTFANIGDARVITRIEGRDGVVSHLNNLGFIVGDAIRIISKLGGNMIIEVKGTRIAIDAKLANKIYI